MLRFQQTPDKIFMEILMWSMDFSIDSIRDAIDNNETIDAAREDIAGILPEAMRVFSPEAAFNTLTDFRDKLQRPELFYLNDYHYLLLYDALDLFSTIHNDMVASCDTEADKKDIATIGEYYIEVVDFELMVELFFYDTDFLLDPQAMFVLGPEMSSSALGLNPETFCLTQGLAPHPEELILKIVTDESYEVPEASKYFGINSTVYPDETLIEDA